MADSKKINKSTENLSDVQEDSDRTPVQLTPSLVEKPVRSARKVHYKEFIAGKGLNRVFLAGFKMYLNGREYMSEAEWEFTLKDYRNRSL